MSFNANKVLKYITTNSKYIIETIPFKINLLFVASLMFFVLLYITNNSIKHQTFV